MKWITVVLFIVVLAQSVISIPVSLKDEDDLIISILNEQENNLLNNLNQLSNEEIRIITILSEDLSSSYIVSEFDKLKLKQKGIGFIDITDNYEEYIDLNFIENIEMINDLSNNRFKKLLTKDDKGKVYPIPNYNYPNSSEFHESKVKELFPLINQTYLFTELSILSEGFHTRYYKSESGLESTMWLFGELLGLSSLYLNKNENSFNVTLFQHKNFLQPSIIFKFYGENFNETNLGENVIVIGCHLDSINLILPSILRAPGAYDNGSGVVTLLEAIRIILEKDIIFKNTIIFQFHAAEEGGLLGSSDLFTKYRKENLPIKAMLQQDMTGYIKKTIDKGYEEHFGVVSKFVSLELSFFIKELINKYCDIPYLDTDFPPQASSDHASAFINGFPSSFVGESKFELMDPYVHSVLDTIEKLDFNHISEHVKLVLSFAYELGFYNDF